jgi:hypothetical protein
MFTAGQIGNNIVAKVKSHLGEAEQPVNSHSNWSDRIKIYLAYVALNSPAAWCAAFASWVTGMVLLEMGLQHLVQLRTASSHEAVNFALRHGTKRDVQSAVAGDWLIEAGGDGEAADDGISYHHTTIYMYSDVNGDCHWIGGNTGDAIAYGSCAQEDCFILRPYVLQ